MLHFLVLFSTLNLVLLGHALVLQKCCPSDHVFNVDDCKCKTNNLPWAPDLLEDYTDITWSILNGLESFYNNNACDGYIIVLRNITKEKFYLESGNLVERRKPDVQSRDFCLDQTSEGDTLAASCQCSKNSVCVNVCCNENEIVETSGQMRCVDQGKKTEIDLKLNKSDQLFALKYDSLSECVTEQIQFLNDTNSLKQHGYEILANGALFIHNGENKEWKQPSEYCVAVTKEGSNSTSMNIIKCTAKMDHRTMINITFSVIRAIFYLATLLVYTLVPELRRAVRGLSLMTHCSCMLAVHIIFTVQRFTVHPLLLSEVQCKILGYSRQFTVLSGFFWLNVICLDIGNTFRSFNSMVRSLDLDFISVLRTFVWYCIYAFGVPFILMVVTIGVEHSGLDGSNLFKPNIGLNMCGFEESKVALYIFFFGPLGLLLLMNIFLFIFVGYKFTSAKTMTSNNEQQYRKRFILFVKLSALMGISFAIGIVSKAAGVKDQYLWFFVRLINLLQTIFLFFMFCCKPKVWEKLKNQSILTPLFQRFSCCRKINHDDTIDCETYCSNVTV